MKRIVAINASPRTEWNTATLVRQAAQGAQSQGAQVTVLDLYKLQPFTGCISCFGCKLPGHTGECVCRDGLTPVLQAIRAADGLIIGTPNYLGDVTAGFRSLYERLIFQYITYKTEPPSYSDRAIPVLFIMTSNAPAEAYARIGYDAMLERYRSTLSSFIGPTRMLISADTLQVNDYERYDWTRFDPAAKRARRIGSAAGRGNSGCAAARLMVLFGAPRFGGAAPLRSVLRLRQRNPAAALHKKSARIDDAGGFLIRHSMARRGLNPGSPPSRSPQAPSPGTALAASRYTAAALRRADGLRPHRALMQRRSCRSRSFCGGADAAQPVRG